MLRRAPDHDVRHGVELLLMLGARTARDLAVRLAAVLVLGCSEQAPDDASHVDPCTSYVPQASPEELAKTPRKDSSAELLALETSNALVAPSALYDRIAADRAAIIAAEPTVMVIKPIFPKLLVTLRLRFEATIWDDVESGAYDAWDCANQAYGGSLELLAQWNGVNVTFGDKRYNGQLLAAEYDALPSLDYDVGYQEIVYDGPDVCLEIVGDQHYYIFDQASGDCPSGCMEHRYFGFQVAPGGAVTVLGDYDPKKVAVEPDWFKARADCRSRL